MTATMDGQQQAGPGAWFDIPGIGGGTQWTDQDENTTNNVTTLQQASAASAQGVLQMKQTDVVVDWQAFFTIAGTYTAGTSTLTTSDYAPWNFIQATKLLIQNQYSSVDVESGIDLYIFNLIRPWRQTFARSNVMANPAGFAIGSTALGYQRANLAQANLTESAQWSTATTTYNLVVRIPASITFDVYYDLTIDGRPNPQLPMPHRAIVSPQYMAGATRIITLQVGYAAGSVATLDNGPVNIGAGTGTFATGSATLAQRRKAVYSSTPQVLPYAYAWQYRWQTKRFTIAGQAKATIPIPADAGQLLCMYVRMFDPSANGALGSAISLANVTRIQFLYGSGLFAFDGTPQQLQADFVEKHGVLLPIGCFCLDLMVDECGYRSNKRALNTLTTAGLVIQVTFTGAQSATAYAVLGIESLVYVA